MFRVAESSLERKREVRWGRFFGKERDREGESRKLHGKERGYKFAGKSQEIGGKQS